MAIEFFRRAPGAPARLGILPGAFNPPTRAHLALAHAGMAAGTASVDEVLFVLPRSFPHKIFEDADFSERLSMLLAATEGEPKFSVGAAAGGLYVDIARECREVYGPETRIAALCGRDSAERIVTWDYGDSRALPNMLNDFEILVASRQGQFEAPIELQHRITTIPIATGFDEVSATEVRERIRRGDAWRHLVPEAIAELVSRIYSTT